MKLKYEHTLEEMARVGKFDNIEIMVYEGEGRIPHFHFRDTSSKRVREGCVRIDIPEYFKHGKYDAIFTKDEKKELWRFLNSPCKITKKYHLPDMNNYQMIKLLWDMNNPDYEIDEDLEMPDYLNELPTRG